MKNSKLIIGGSMALFILLYSQLSGQFILPNYQAAKFQDGEIKIRWEPKSIEEWEESLHNGYVVESYMISNGNRNMISKDRVHAKDVESWSSAANKASSFKQPFYDGGQNLMYPEDLDDINSDPFFQNFKGDSRSGLDTFRLGYLSYVQTYDFQLADLCGMGFSMKAESGMTYEFDVYVPGFDRLKITVNTNDYLKENLPELKATWGDEFVELKWNTKELKENYFGYILEKSDEGLYYTALDSLPYVNTMDGEGHPELHNYITRDSLAENYHTYYYKLRGMDYFGAYSEKASAVSGSGYDEFQFSPRIIKGEQMEDNTAHIVWDLPGGQEELIKDFSVLWAPEEEGEYEIAMDSINRDFREIYVPMEHERNFYRLQVNPYDGPSTSSTTVFVMGMDTIPPAIPVPISATINEEGIVDLLWEANTEQDLWGYKIFRANFENQEYSLLNANPQLDTVFQDTINLKQGSENIYYVLQAADTRNNRSDFTEPIILEKPDVLPPGKPVIASVKQMTDSIAVHWMASSSDDVVLHRIFRRNLKEENSWTFIAELDTLQESRVYYDMGLPYDHTYAYTILAIDDAALESGPSSMKHVYFEKPKELFEPFTAIEKVVNEEEGTISLTWETNTDKTLESVLIYRGYAKDQMGKYKYVDAPDMKLVDKIPEEEHVYYILKPVFEDQEKAYYSDIIEIEIPTEEK